MMSCDVIVLTCWYVQTEGMPRPMNFIRAWSEG